MSEVAPERLDDVEIAVLQDSSLDPCPQAAAEILWLRARLEWLPIAAAPKHGWFLGWNGVFWFIATWCQPVRGDNDGEFMDAFCGSISPPLTHFMALTEGPE